MYFKLIKEQNLRKVSKLLYIFLTTTDELEKYAKMMHSNSSDNCAYRYNVEILNPFDLELLINSKTMIKKKIKELLNELTKFRQYQP